ncbi:MAG TPA: hypothetical protein VMG12_06050 [Polyangiaceae bacterium]|nr:hypothetical protein [Polyangiaceae bacterium]
MGAVAARHLDEGAPSSSAKSWTLEHTAPGTLLLRFVGPTLTAEIPGLFAAMTRHMPRGTAHLVFDIRQLEGHNSEVRAAFQRWLMEHRSRISNITVVVRKAATVLQMAASVVKLATGLRLEIRDDLESDAAVFHLG